MSEELTHLRLKLACIGGATSAGLAGRTTPEDALNQIREILLRKVGTVEDG